MSKEQLSEITRRSLEVALTSERASLIRSLAQGRANEQVNALDQVRPGPLSPDRFRASKARLDAARRLLGSELMRVESALDRVHSGEFGQCQSCGELIERARLREDPAASRCGNCRDIA